MARKRSASRPRAVKLSKEVVRFVERERVARVATAGQAGMPHVVPVCHALIDGKVYLGSGDDARKVLNVRENPHLAITVDLYAEDWSQLKGVMLQGTARVLEPGPAFRRVRKALYAKYPQYPTDSALDEDGSVIVELTPTHVFTWGFD
jgi:PPOX class probable F420-dependent enzyme